MLRRLSLPWVLSLLLVLAQQGGVLHELGHLSHGHHSTGPSLSAQQPTDIACPTCEAFAQVANPASGTASTLAASAAAYFPPPTPTYAIIAADNPTPRSRGPPQS